MKSIKFISMMICCMAALVFVSCDKNDDNTSALTPEQVQMAYQTVRGNYTGKLIYPKASNTTGKTVNDTVGITWSIATDSIMTIRNFPAAALAEHITNADLKQALLTQPAQDIRCYIGFLTLSPVRFLINPVSPSYTLTYGGATHTVHVGFYVNSTYSLGVYNTNTKELQMQIIEGAVYVDKVRQTDYLKSGVPFLLKATKI